jgi:Chitobiase/beta-hexosaminidase C-terminal domain
VILAGPTLTFNPSTDEMVSGVPEYVEIDANEPATIYYTVDGSVPTISSTIYVGSIYTRTGTESFTLQAFGVDGSDVAGPVLTQTFAADTTRAAKSRLVNGEGVIVDSAVEAVLTTDGFDANGAAIRFETLDPQEVEDLTVRSAKGRDGIDQGTQVIVNVPDPSTTSYPYDDNFQEVSTTQYAATFNPYAKTILIDNRITNEVQLTLRTFQSLENVYTENGGKRIREQTTEGAYISGGKVRSFYDQRNNVMVGYWFDHNNERWIRNITTLPANIPQTIGHQTHGYPYVFSWISRGRDQSPNI